MTLYKLRPGQKLDVVMEKAKRNGYAELAFQSGGDSYVIQAPSIRKGALGLSAPQVGEVVDIKDGDKTVLSGTILARDTDWVHKLTLIGAGAAFIGAFVGTVGVGGAVLAAVPFLADATAAGVMVGGGAATAGVGGSALAAGLHLTNPNELPNEADAIASLGWTTG
jgi:hypothetical protein